MIRRTLTALATAVSALGVVALPTAGPASAEGVCTLTPPSRIALYKDITEFPTSITGECQPDGYGYWYGPGEQEAPPNYAAAFVDASTGDNPSIVVPDRLAMYGRQQWLGYGAVSDANCTESFQRSARAGAGSAPRTKSSTKASSTARAQADCDELTQNEPFSDIRLGGYASLTGTRSGSLITFTAGSGGWSPASNKLIVRPYISGEIQTQYADGTWHRVGNPFRTGSTAKATIVATIPTTRTFRYAMYSTASYFDRASTAITR